MVMRKPNVGAFHVSGFRFQVNVKLETWNLKRRRRGQMTLEYAMVIAVVASALIGMSLYIRRGFSGRLRAGADSVSNEPYDPRHATADTMLTIVTDSTTTSTLTKDKPVATDPNCSDLSNPSCPRQPADVVETTTSLTKDETTRTGSETVGAIGTDLWN